MKKLLFVFIVLFFSFSVYSQQLTILAVGDATLEKEKIIVDQANKSGTISKNDQKLVYEMLEIFANDFSFYRKYFVVDRLFTKTKDPQYDFLLNQNKTLNSTYLIRSSFNKEKDNTFKVEVKLFNLKDNKELMTLSESFKESNIRTVGHKITNNLYKKITGKESIFESFFVYVSNKVGTRKNPIKELYKMDFDGRRVERLTFHRETVVSPAISHSKDKVMYSLISLRGKKRNIDLYEYNLKTKKRRVVSSLPGINSGAVYLPGDEKIILTLSFTGNAEIFEMNLKNKRKRNITRHFSEDVDPSISKDGKLMSFLSSRPGKAMIYTLDPSGTEKNVKRISFVGKFNATPRFSPDGTQIAFSSWVDNRFDIYRIGSNGNGLFRLTKDFGSNEDPTYSLDGEFIAFSSQRVLSKRKATQDVYIMTSEGDILGKITHNQGNCISPRWSK